MAIGGRPFYMQSGLDACKLPSIPSRLLKHTNCTHIEGTSERPFRTPSNKQADIHPIF